ncbi:unnamed protein product [Sphagnum jensenii]
MNDAYLLNSADSVMARIRYENGQLKIDLPPAAQDILEHNDRDKFYYEVSESDGTFLSGDATIPGPSITTNSKPVFYNATINGDNVRVIKMTHKIESNQRFLIVQCAETLNARRNMYEQALLADLAEHVIFLIFVAAAVFIGIDQGLKPLKLLEEKISQRMPLQLDPIDVESAPLEVANVIMTINTLFTTLNNFTQARARFVANAAHQLRTPIAGSKTYLDMAMKQVSDQRTREALEKTNLGLTRMQLLINRLLVLERSESEARARSQVEAVDLNEVAAAACFELADLAVAREIELECLVGEKSVNVVGDRESLVELIKNLLDNAIRYSRIGDRVTASVDCSDGVKLVVEDSGIGIPVGEREKIFERFYRVDATGVEGTGLGLSIVKEIANGHGASVVVSEATGGKGTRVEVGFSRFQA